MQEVSLKYHSQGMSTIGQTIISITFENTPNDVANELIENIINLQNGVISFKLDN